MSMVIVHDINGTDYNIDSADLSFNPAVYGIIVQNGKILLMPTNGKYAIPGGSIDLGENHIDALKREIKEETGFDISPRKLLTAYSSLYKSFKTGKNFHCLQLFYVCDIIGNKSDVPEFTADEQKYLKPAQWHNISELKDLEYIGTEPLFDLIAKTFQ